MKYDYDRKCRMKIQDDWWEIYLITDEEAHELDEKINDSEDGFRALTLTKEDGQCMFFVEGNVTKNIVAHELFHLYVSYFNLESADVDTDAFEEIVAEFLENNMDKFLRIRNKIFNKIRRL